MFNSKTHPTVKIEDNYSLVSTKVCSTTKKTIQPDEIEWDTFNKKNERLTIGLMPNTTLTSQQFVIWREAIKYIATIFDNASLPNRNVFLKTDFELSADDFYQHIRVMFPDVKEISVLRKNVLFTMEHLMKTQITIFNHTKSRTRLTRVVSDGVIDWVDPKDFYDPDDPKKQKKGRYSIKRIYYFRPSEHLSLFLPSRYQRKLPNPFQKKTLKCNTFSKYHLNLDFMLALPKTEGQWYNYFLNDFETKKGSKPKQITYILTDDFLCQVFNLKKLSLSARKQRSLLKSYLVDLSNRKELKGRISIFSKRKVVVDWSEK